jgi:hypothetical protein
MTDWTADGIVLGKRRDVVLFVDDWKGANAGPDDPVYYFARGFALCRSDEFKTIQELLVRSDAGNWHAKERKSLFTSEHYEDIFRALDVSSSFVFDALLDRKTLLAPHLDADAASLDPEYWPPSNAYARGLVRALSLLQLELALEFHARNYDRPMSVLVVTDCLDWLSGRPEPIVELPPPKLPTGAERFVSLEAVSVRDKRAAASQPFLPFLGLVDSESWHFGRIQSTKLIDGMTVRSRLQAWRDNGRPDQPVLTGEDEQIIRASLRAENGWHFAVNALLGWAHRRRTLVNPS